MIRKHVAAAIDEGRLWRRHEEAARIGAIDGGGVNRQAFSAEDIAARRLLLSWAAERGFAPFVDAFANLFIRRPGRDADAAPVLTGSHMDSQPRGGRFDGIYGVLAGLAALEALDDAGVATRCPVEVVAWSNEEGGRFAPGAMGSGVYTGANALSDMLEIRDGDGIRLGDALAETLAATPEIAKRVLGAPVAAYVETHIEQGPILEAAGETIGVVTGIQGLRWIEVDIHGETAHAGTTPIGSRRDALQAAVRCLSALNLSMTDPQDVLRFTVGRLEVIPNAPNSVASQVTFTVDLRHPDDAVLTDRCRQLAADCAAAAAPCTVTVKDLVSILPCRFDDGIVSHIEGAARDLGLRYRSMSSGAFHDAGYMSRICPTGMIFVPCEKGISHNVAENATPGDLAAGARVLAATLAEIA